MKSSTPESMKFKRLQRRLKVNRCVAAGLLELLWIATSKNAPQGDIGRFSNEEIAIECDWEGDHDQLVAALVDCGWLDEHDQCRLVVHDWADHCPHHVANNLKRWGKDFIVPSDHAKERPKEFTKDDPKEHPKERPKDIPSKPSLAEPSVTKPDLAQSSQAKIAAARAADGCLDFASLEGTGKISDAATRLAKAVDKRRIAGVDSAWIWSHAAVGELLKPGFISEVSSKILDRQIAKPKAYVEKALRDECDAVGVPLPQALLQVPEKPIRREVASA